MMSSRLIHVLVEALVIPLVASQATVFSVPSYSAYAWSAPPGCIAVQAVVIGGGGGGGYTSAGGAGAQVVVVFSVAGNTTPISAYVGAGGPARSTDICCGSGGAASGVVVSGALFAIAGGGGGCTQVGGAGGQPNGASALGSLGATQSVVGYSLSASTATGPATAGGGSVGADCDTWDTPPAAPVGLWPGGAGACDPYASMCYGGGGGGGGGYYGGGAGGCVSTSATDSYGYSGGGGSSWASASVLSVSYPVGGAAGGGASGGAVNAAGSDGSVSLQCTLTASQTATTTQTPSHSESPTATLTSSTTSTSTVTGSPSQSLSPSWTRTPSATASLTPSVTQSRTVSLTPSATSTGSQMPSSSSTPTLTTSASQSATPSSTQTPSGTASQTRSPSETPTVSLTPTSSPTASETGSSSGTPSATRTQSATGTLTPSTTATVTSSSTQSPSQAATPSSTLTGSLTPSQSMTLTPTPSTSPPPFSLLISEGAAPPAPPAFASVISRSDSEPAEPLRIWISRCPGDIRSAIFSSESLECGAVAHSSAQSQTATAYVALSAVGAESAAAASNGAGSSESDLTAAALAFSESTPPCDPTAGSVPVLLSPVAWWGVFFRAAPSVAILSCRLVDPSSYQTLATSAMALSITATRWPLWDDAIIVSASGVMHSNRLALGLNATEEMQAIASRVAAACEVNNESALASTACSAADCATLLASVQRPTVPIPLRVALSQPCIVLTAAQTLWDSTASLLANSDTGPFTLTLSGASRMLLRGTPGHITFTRNTTAVLGGAPCNVSAISADGVWAMIDTPPAARVCGSDSQDCGYIPFSTENPPSGDFKGAALTCPPFCPGKVRDNVVPVPAVGGGFALGVQPSSAEGTLPHHLPAAAAASVDGIYYAVSCAESGQWTDPSSGACVDAANPASLYCAYRSAAGCETCPVGALCPGGSRLWSRAGYWVATETSPEVTPCAPPDPSVKCVGWDTSTGAVQCGSPCLQGSLLCGACAPGYFLYGDGSCSQCPVIRSTWDRYRALIELVASVFALAIGVIVLLVCLVKCTGGSLAGRASLLASLVQWSFLSVQTVSQAATASAASLPAVLASLFRGLSVLQFDGVLLPPSCTGAFAFENEVGIMTAAIIAAGSYLCVVLAGPRASEWVLITGSASLRAALLLFPPPTRAAISLLNCAPAVVSAVGAAGLNGGERAATPELTRRGATTTLDLLVSNSFYVCWAPGGAHAPAGAIAVVTVVVVVVAFPLLSLLNAWRQVTSRSTVSQPCTHMLRHCGDIRRSCLREGARRRGVVSSKTSVDMRSIRAVAEWSPQNVSLLQSTTPANVQQPAQLPPLLVPFLSDYRASAWYTRFLDIALAFFLAAIQALIPHPTTSSNIGKAAAICVSTLLLAGHTVIVRPFAPRHAWKGPVRAALLVLAAVCAITVAWATAVDAQGTSGRDKFGLEVSTYVLMGVFAIVLSSLIFGVGAALLRGVRVQLLASPPSKDATLTQLQRPGSHLGVLSTSDKLMCIDQGKSLVKNAKPSTSLGDDVSSHDGAALSWAVAVINTPIGDEGRTRFATRAVVHRPR